jgi:UDP-N-acetylglucosamine:LPS N-acetylglucosamine transferase
MAKKKIIVATVPVGGGHMAAATAVSEALTRLYGDWVEVKLCDVLTEHELRRMVPLDKLAVRGYAGSVKLLNSYPYKLFFELADISHKLVNQFFSASFRERGTAYLQSEDPDAVVTTFPIISYAMVRIMEEGWHKKVPMVSIVTDAGNVNKLWLMDKSDYILAATPETINYARKLGVPEGRVKFLGFPVAAAFRHLPVKAKARKQLGLSNKFTVLLSGGGLGLSNKMLRLAVRLAKLQTGATYLFVAGRNEQLKEKLSALSFRDEVKIFGHVDNMPQLIAASDLVVGKAGWLTVYEAMMAKKFTLAIDVIPGQEDENAQYLEKHNIGKVVKDMDEATQIISGFADKPEELEAYAKNFETLKLDPRAADKIARFVVELVDGHQN